MILRLCERRENTFAQQYIVYTRFYNCSIERIEDTYIEDSWIW